MSLLIGSSAPQDYKLDYIYYNISIENNSSALSFIPAEFSETKTDNYLNGDTSDWLATIVRFRVPTTSVPIMFWKNNTYYLTIQTPDGTNYPVGPPPQPVQYYAQTTAKTAPYNTAVFSFTAILKSINDALNTVWSTIPVGNANMNQVPEISPGVPIPAPFFSLDSATQLLSLTVPDIGEYAPIGVRSWYTLNAPPAIPLTSTWKIIFNTALYQLMPSFPALFLKSPNSGNPTPYDNRDYVLSIDINPYNIYDSAAIPTINYDHIKITQEFSTIYKFNQLTSIFVTTNKIPVVREYIGNPTFAENVQTPGNGSNVIINSPIFLDFEPNATDIFTRNYFQYVTTYPRYVNLLQRDGLKEIDLAFHWVGNVSNGEVYPLYLSPGDTLSCKIQFSRRSTLIRVSKHESSQLGGAVFNSTSMLNTINPEPIMGSYTTYNPSWTQSQRQRKGGGQKYSDSDDHQKVVKRRPKKY